MDDCIPEVGTFKWYCFWSLIAILAIPILIIGGIFDTVYFVFGVGSYKDIFWYE